MCNPYSTNPKPPLCGMAQQPFDMQQRQPGRAISARKPTAKSPLELHTTDGGVKAATTSGASDSLPPMSGSQKSVAPAQQACHSSSEAAPYLHLIGANKCSPMQGGADRCERRWCSLVVLVKLFALERWRGRPPVHLQLYRQRSTPAVGHPRAGHQAGTLSPVHTALDAGTRIEWWPACAISIPPWS